MPKPKDTRKPTAGAQTEVTALELKRGLGQMLARAGFGNERIAITRNGRRIAALVSADDLAALDGAA